MGVPGGIDPVVHAGRRGEGRLPSGRVSVAAATMQTLPGRWYLHVCWLTHTTKRLQQQSGSVLAVQLTLVQVPALMIFSQTVVVVNMAILRLQM